MSSSWYKVIRSSLFIHHAPYLLAFFISTDRPSARRLTKLFLNGVKDPAKRPIRGRRKYSSWPSAYNLLVKVEIASNAVRQAYGPSSSMPKKDKEELEEALECIWSKCAQEHITLEVLVSLITIRSGNRLDKIWDAPHAAIASPTSFHTWIHCWFGCQLEGQEQSQNLIGFYLQPTRSRSFYHRLQ